MKRCINKLGVLALFFSSVSIMAMEVSTITIESCDGEELEIPLKAALTSKVIRKQRDPGICGTDKGCVTFYSLEEASKPEREKIATKRILEEVFRLSVNLELCKGITSKGRLKKLFQCAHYLDIPPLLRQLTKQMHHCMDIDELKHDSEYVFFAEVIRKRMYAYSIYDFMKELPDPAELSNRVLDFPAGGFHYLDLSGIGLESLAGLREIINHLKDQGLPAIKGIKMTKNKLSGALNIAKLCKLGMELIDAEDNHISRLVLPAQLPACRIYLANNRIKNIPDNLKAVDQHCIIDLLNNPLRLESKRFLTQFIKTYYKNNQTPRARFLSAPCQVWVMISLPLLIWSFLVWLAVELNTNYSPVPWEVFLPFFLAGCWFTVAIGATIDTTHPDIVREKSYERPIILGLKNL